MKVEAILKSHNLSSLNLIICVENANYAEYLRMSFAEHDLSAKFVEIENLPRFVSEEPKSTLVLQSNTMENILFDIGKKLKGIFFKDLKVIFMSFDYQLTSDSQKSFSSFLQAPASFDQIISEANRLSQLRKKVLLIDDSKLVHKNLVGPLRQKGFEVEQAFNGEEGVKKAIANKPDVIICDIEMPIMNGFEACAAIRANSETENCYIIMSSTLKSNEDQKRGFASGVDEYVPKPVIFDDLLERINRSFKLRSVLRERILIVDENIRQAEIIASFLSKQGFSTRLCQGLNDAKNIFKNFSCDLIISSNNLTDGSILDVGKFCRNINTNGMLEFIGIVNQEDEAERRLALNSGAIDTISSPPTSEAVAAVVERTVAEIRTKRDQDQFQKYVSKASFQSALEKSVLSGLELPTRAEKRQAIVFFMDIAQFTNRCERYPPEEIVRQINTMFEEITEIIINNNGDIDKFIGDACMAFWFNDQENNSNQSAVSAVLKIKAALHSLNSNDEVLVNDPIKIRMGLNSGEVILCDIGASKARVDLTLIGDAVNVAARLESACSKYFVDNLISENLASLTEADFLLRPIDKIALYGKDLPIIVYEVISEIHKASDSQLKLANIFTKALKSYFDGNFKQALNLFIEAKKFENLNLNNSSPSEIFAERCEQFIADPPDDWDGIIKMESK